LKEYCENPCCENPGLKKVPVSVRHPSDQVRTLCAPCEEAYTWGVQHGMMSAMGRLVLSQLAQLLEGRAFVVLAKNSADPSPDGAFESWAYKGALDFEVAEPICFGIGTDTIDALRALDEQLPQSATSGLRPPVRTPLLITKRELATILTGLRLYQAENLQGTDGAADEATREIATDAGLFEPLSSDEIDELCERLNLDEAVVSPQACEHKWRDASGLTTVRGVEHRPQCSRCSVKNCRCVEQEGRATEEACPPEAGER